MILVVAIDTPLRRTFDYRCPPHIEAARVAPGCRVWVPFGRRRVVGVVLEQRTSTDVPTDKLRAVHATIDDAQPTFDAALLGTLLWAAEYYKHPPGEVVAAALPPALRAGAALVEAQSQWHVTAAGLQALRQLSARAKRMRAVLEILRERPASASELKEATSASMEVLRSLGARGFVEERALTRTPLPPDASVRQSSPRLNEAQQAALERIRASLGTFTTHLLYGVTGSGKTEVYLQAISSVLERGQQALVLVPEIALTPQTIARFRARFQAPVAVLHSGLSDGERLQAWRRARSGEAGVVIGTRSAVWAPLAAAGLIVIDEEHDTSFKQQEGFRYSARDLALVRAQRLSIPIVLGSATPSLESLARAHRQPESMLRLPERAASAQLPRWSLIDMRKHGNTQGIATPVVLAVQRHLQTGSQAMMFLNRRGYAPVLFCPKCGWSARCPRCDANLTVHARFGALLCHHCGTEQAAVLGCPSCFGPVKPVGQGTERIEESVASLFPNVPMARIDRDSIRRKGELEAVLERVDRGEVRILIGTQMLAKGHDFPNVTLVAVLNADQGLFSTDFRASERLAQMLVQVAGRAGRADRAGEVLIQTEYPEHPLLNLLLQGGYEAFAQGALQEREQCRWPPFSRLALLRAEATTAVEPQRFLRVAADLARANATGDLRVLGPAPAVMERRAGRHRAQLLIHAPSHGPLQKFLSRWLPQLEAQPQSKRVRWSIDVDPIELS